MLAELAERDKIGRKLFIARFELFQLCDEDMRQMVLFGRRIHQVVRINLLSDGEIMSCSSNSA